jgi:hypothetical protein
MAKLRKQVPPQSRRPKFNLPLPTPADFQAAVLGVFAQHPEGELLTYGYLHGQACNRIMHRFFLKPITKRQEIEEDKVSEKICAAIRRMVSSDQLKTINVVGNALEVNMVLARVHDRQDVLDLPAIDQ